MSKNIKVLFSLLIILCIGCTGCNLEHNSIAEEYSKETYIRIENIPKDTILGMNMKVMDGGNVCETQEMQMASEKSTGKGDVTFRINKEELPEGTDFSTLCAVVSVLEKDGSEFEVAGGTLLFEFGTDYWYELMFENGKYYLKKVL